jgi:hypothetical protein
MLASITLRLPQAPPTDGPLRKAICGDQGLCEEVTNQIWPNLAFMYDMSWDGDIRPQVVAMGDVWSLGAGVHSASRPESKAPDTASSSVATPTCSARATRDSNLYQPDAARVWMLSMPRRLAKLYKPR